MKGNDAWRLYFVPGTLHFNDATLLGQEVSLRTCDFIDCNPGNFLLRSNSQQLVQR